MGDQSSEKTEEEEVSIENCIFIMNFAIQILSNGRSLEILMGAANRIHSFNR